MQLKEETAAKGLRLMKASHYGEVKAYADACASNRQVKQLLKGALVEQEMHWRMVDYGIDAKAKADAIVPGKHLVDLKFVREPQSFARMTNQLIRDYHYDRQMAWYLTGAIANGLLDESAEVWLIVVVKAAPYVVMPFKMSAKTLLQGHSKYTKICQLVQTYNQRRMMRTKFFNL